MPAPAKRRVTPGVPPSSVPARNPPRLRPALGGGRGPGVPATAAAQVRELWLAIHLPHYVLESLRWRAALAGEGPPAAEGTVVVNAEERGQVVQDCDAAAAAAGIAPGMALNSALALWPALCVQSREVAVERALLEAVATLGTGFTPRVAMERPDAVLLEVRGSLGLFGGVRDLTAAMRGRLRRLGLDARLALAPTPLAALWFARTGEEVALGRREGLASRLAPLPLACARWPEKSLQSLGTMGVRTIGECLRLPRDGFARRFGPVPLLALDRALGRVPDPRASFVPRERFSARRDLEPEVADAARLEHAAGPLVEELCAFLRLRGCGVDAVELALMHREAPATRVRLRFVEPASQPGRIIGLLREHLASTPLPEPVRTLRLRSGPPLPVGEIAGDLFLRHARRATGVPQLVERLRARLGAEAVQGLCLVAEHRPERAWENRGHSPISDPPFSASVVVKQKLGNVPYFPCRPLWLLAEPQSLRGTDRPSCEGPLEIEDGPERIESGWWDGGDVTRDYYVARNRAGARLWVFRERRPGGRWFLHGVFG